MKVEAGKHVHIHYTLKNDAGEVLDSSEGRGALGFTAGAGEIIPGLEAALMGKSQGDHVEVTVAPKDGYGERIPEAVQEVPKAQFAAIPGLQVGMPLQAQTQEGVLTVFVAAINEDTVVIDGNHPLAGETLHFSVDIDVVHDAHDHHHDDDGPKIYMPH